MKVKAHLVPRLLPLALLASLACTVACNEHARGAATPSDPPRGNAQAASTSPLAQQAAPAPTPPPVAPGATDCGSIVDALNKPGSNEAAASRCFLDAFKACLPAKLSHTRVTDEGGTVVQSMAVVKNGSTCEVAVVNDTSRDPHSLGSTSERCTNMKLDKTASGATLGFQGCR